MVVRLLIIVVFIVVGSSLVSRTMVIGLLVVVIVVIGLLVGRVMIIGLMAGKAVVGAIKLKVGS